LIVAWIYMQNKAVQFISDSKIGYQYEKMLVAQNKTNLLVNIILQTLSNITIIYQDLQTRNIKNCIKGVKL
jgi:hypothetical protein